MARSGITQGRRSGPPKGKMWVRIKRMGDQWATCGIGITPPSHLIQDPSMKRLCTKLVPGQVVELPDDHKIMNNYKLVERVSALEADEFMRPWVFDDAEQAAMADPSKSMLDASQIASGLAMADNAVYEQQQKLAEREAARQQADDDEDDDDAPLQPNRRSGRAVPEEEDENAKRSGNRHKAEVYEDAEELGHDTGERDDAEEDEDEATEPVKRTGRRGARAGKR